MRARVAAAVALVVLAACGYTTRRLESFAPRTTIAVVPFEHGFYRDLDLRLQQAIAEQVRARTPYQLATPDDADLVISGRFGESRPVILQRVDRSIILQRLQGTASVTVTERRSGRVVKSYDVYAISEFMPDQPGGLLSPTTPDLAEDQAISEWTRRLAIDVVEGLEPGF
jgi:hypothetical protein